MMRRCLTRLRSAAGPRTQDAIRAGALQARINLRYNEDGSIGVALDETTNADDLMLLLEVFGAAPEQFDCRRTGRRLSTWPMTRRPRAHQRLPDPSGLQQLLSETEMLRYIHRLQERDLSLTHSMIPLGSCTMKLNATAEMLLITLPEFGHLHPFAPLDQTKGYQELFERLETLAGGDHRLRGRLPAAQFRRPGRIHRHAHHSRLSLNRAAIRSATSA